MQWDQTKLLFIICFLVLDIFLIQQLLTKEDYKYSEESSTEEEIASNIEGLKENVSDESFEAPLIYAMNKSYSESDITSLEKLNNQQQVIVNNYLLIGRFKEPVPINLEDESYQEKLNGLIFNSQSYTFWGKDTSKDILIFFQQIEYPIFYNKNALLLIQLNDNGEMIQYVQTMMEKEKDDQQDPEKLNSQMNAISTLFLKENLIETGDKVTDVNLGYHNLISLPNGEQVLNPTWNVEVNETEDYFVNAIEGHNYPRNNDFIDTTYHEFIDEMQASEQSSLLFLQTEDEDEEEELYETIKQGLLNIGNTIIGVGNE
ncbi:Two-component system YycFG regulatory protein [Paraliobacillus sp. PM-2]|uniref:two-component system regulatory protein YycI n=1 Tax=Paraliobacillus sp. PM-2 TaxID=1462524 RepID=UPI00061C7337|nr:two-component system regulatory protein YycI [Paraliobacillus sp. PM-2]CQR45840.1 Two-component system YycFG regulatory protein [Paraliobacillus sp. PM-2]